MRPSSTVLRTMLRSSLLFCTILLPVLSATADEGIDFEDQIAPLLIKRCVECHQGPSPSGDLGLTTKADWEAADHDYLLERVVAGEMPPEQQGQSQKLPAQEIAQLQNWVEAGGAWPDARELDYFERTNELRAGRDWWSLQPVKRPTVPKLLQHPQPDNPIDAFVLARLEEESMQPAPPADRRTLIRRLYFDLLGLPPTEEQIQDFINDPHPQSWSRLVDKLLAMPQYGERWGRYWLDLARYADTSGYERDQEKPYAWRYRDWVVDAFNRDMPYEQFIIEQLAGDEIPGANEASVIATGFLRLAPWNDEPNDREDYQYDRIEDLVHTTSSAFLAMTVKCARCHSHKFDAITQDDYYRMASVFWTGPVTSDRGGAHLGGPSTEELGYERVLGWTDIAPHRNIQLLKNGERSQPMHEVLPASLSSVPSLERQFTTPADSKTSQRRLQLAHWIADQKNPLTARVIVNRIWQHHFGQAIVRTPNNFGFLANPATHPQLLDWLAAEFWSQGGSIKAMHRLILNSQTWQQSSQHPNWQQLSTRDANNRLLWRAERRRLDAETLRDALLSASGELDLTVGGEGFRPTITPEALEGLSRKGSAWQASPKEDQRRRSLYIYLKRGLLPPFMTRFDLCDPTQSCGQRTVTTAPTQALAMMNNQFVHDRSNALASQILAQHGTSADEQADCIRAAWKSILRRQPSANERQLAAQHLAEQTLRFEAALATERNETNQRNTELPPLALHFRADQAEFDPKTQQEVTLVRDLSGHGHDAIQPRTDARPQLERSSDFGGQASLRFDGQQQFLQLRGSLLPTDHEARCTLVAVASDRGQEGHRAILSNWNGAAGNSVLSVFLGLTGEATVRFSDQAPDAGRLVDRNKPFILIAINDDTKTQVWQNGRLLGEGAPLTNRRLDTDWVIGQQGNINGEYWDGNIAEIRVYRQVIDTSQRVLIERELAERYHIGLAQTPSRPRDARTLALASLCHVLMNSNEFLYVD